MTEKSRENYLRVTQVLYPFSGLDKIDSQVVAHAADRGTKVHQICEAIISGVGEFGVDDEVSGYVESFKRWWDLGHKLVSMEQRFWDDQLHITGQVDIIIDTPEGFAIVDLKTSSKVSKTWEAQGCAYAYLAKNAGINVQKILFIHLNKFGKDPKIHEYPIDESFFLSCLRVYKHFFQKD